MLRAISTRFDTDTITRLNKLATYQERSRSDIVKDAVTSYLNHIMWYGAEIQKARNEIADGHLVDANHVKAKILELGLHVD